MGTTGWLLPRFVHCRAGGSSPLFFALGPEDLLLPAHWCSMLWPPTVSPGEMTTLVKFFFLGKTPSTQGAWVPVTLSREAPVVWPINKLQPHARSRGCSAGLEPPSLLLRVPTVGPICLPTVSWSVVWTSCDQGPGAESPPQAPDL